MIEMLNGYKPEDLGLDPDEYPSFRTDPLSGREVQLEAIEFGMYCEKWVAAGRIPTGIGKMLIAWCLHKITGLRTCILTGTKGLQDQYKGKFERYGLVDIRGRSNYTCGHYNQLNCRSGASMGCPYTNGHGCTYERAKDAAKNEPCVSTNYSYWMTVNDKANGLERSGEDAEFNGANPIELLILDEAHDAAGKLSDYLGFRFSQRELSRFADPKEMGDELSQWKDLAKETIPGLEDEIRTTGMELAHLGHKATQAQVRVLHELEEQLLKFERVADMGGDDWVLEARTDTRMGREWSFDVVWPGKYASQYLFCDVPKVYEMSATLNQKDLWLQGLGKDVYEFRDWRRIFPVNNCPIYYCPPLNEEGKAVRVVNKTSDVRKLLWVRHMDDIIGSRLDRRIVVITSSYKYQQFIMENSRWGGYMIGNKGDVESGTAMDNFVRFIESEPPIILCSPSFGTGWDFAFERCELLILSKVPLRVPGGASKVMAKRLERDGEYGDNETMRDVVQACGRPQRDEKDTAEVVIADGSWGWFGYRNQHLAPTGFVKDVRQVREMPSAPKSIKQREQQ